jgi:hypothetical protein
MNRSGVPTLNCIVSHYLEAEFSGTPHQGNTLFHIGCAAVADKKPEAVGGEGR